MLDFDPGETASVRLRVDSATTRYAVDFDDIGHIGNAVVRTRHYFVLPAGEKLVAAWVESTGLSRVRAWSARSTHPYATDEPAPVNPATLAAQQVDTRSLRDGFSAKTPTVQPKSFGAATAAGVRAVSRTHRRAQSCPSSPIRYRRHAPYTLPGRRSFASISTRRVRSSALS